jgi:hypothetical protein
MMRTHERRITAFGIFCTAIQHVCTAHSPTITAFRRLSPADMLVDCKKGM